MDEIFKQRIDICGDMWPPADLKNLTTLEVFERVMVCSRNLWMAYHDGEMSAWAAWRNAEDIYADEMRVRLGGVGIVFQNTPFAP